MSRRTLGLAVLALSATALTPALSANAAPSQAGLSHRNVKVCATAAAGEATCNSIRHDTVSADGKVQPNAATPSGLGPTQLRTAYGLTTLQGTPTSPHPIVAIVDAYDDPNAASDLATYRSTYGLPAIGNCAVGTGQLCFQKVSQTGTSSYPRANGGWAQEISLDLDMVSAACEECSILLVEASSASFANLAAAEVTAGTLGAKVISNSYGGSESTGSASSYDIPGVAITASTGDSGQVAAQSPASYPSVIAVGGTSLNATNPKSESAWSGAGSFCSTAFAYTPGQQAYATTETAACGTKRGAADISSVADPNTGVAVYDSYAYQGVKGWLVFGGTSASSPFVGAVIALSGKSATYAHVGGSPLYGNASSFSDVLTGSNGSCTTSLCNAGFGWDGPTGLGSVNGTAGL